MPHKLIISLWGYSYLFFLNLAKKPFSLPGIVTSILSPNILFAVSIYAFPDGAFLFDITGSVFNNNKILVIFPKHYFDSNSLSIKNESNEYLKDDITENINKIKAALDREQTKEYMELMEILKSEYKEDLEKTA